MHKLFEVFIGILIALFFLVGRWGFSRLLTDESTVSFLTQPRYWIGFILMIFLFIPLRGYKKSTYENYRPTHYVTIFSFIFLSYMVVTGFWSPWKDESVNKIYEIILLIIIILVLHRWSVYGGLKHIRQTFWITLSILCIFLAISSFLSLIRVSFDIYRISVLGGGPNALGRNMGFLCLACLMFTRQSRYTYVFLIITVFAYLLVILTGSRGALIATTIAIVVYMMINDIHIKYVLSTMIFSGLLGFIILFFTPLGTAITNILEYRVGSLLIDQYYDSGRSLIYEEALQISNENLIFGVGLAGFSTYTSISYPHNLELEALTEGGMIGLLLLLLLLFIYMSQILGHFKTVHKTTFAAFILAFVFSQFSGDLFDTRTLFILMILSFNPIETTATDQYLDSIITST